MVLPLPRLLAHRLFWLWLYCACLLLPSAVVSGDGLCKALYPLLFLLALSNHYRRFFWITLGFYLIAPVALYYEIIYEVPPEASLWLILLGSSSVETADYLQHLNYYLVAAVVLPYFLLLPFFYGRLPDQPFATGRGWQLAGLLLLLVPGLRFFREKDSLDGYLSVYRHYKQSYPLNVMLGYPAAKIEISRVRALVDTQKKMLCSQNADVLEKPQTVVVVIGESARRDRLGVFGYERATTPEMSKRNDQLWLFDDVISSSFETAGSVPTILTGHLGDQGQLRPSFLQAFRSAGFETYWLSNQAQYGEYDSLVSAYAVAAEKKVFLHQHSYSVSLRTVYDEALLPFLDEALREKTTPKKLIVLHLYGSHADFSKRYPATFNYFPDSYDNSIRYTDHVLGSVIDRVAKVGGLSTVMYVADHGLNLGKCPGKSYHFNEKSNYEVPMMLWASPEWRAANPSLVGQLSAAKKSLLTTEVVMPSLLTMAHVSCPAAAYERSLFASGKKAISPRRVKTLAGVMPYDTAHDDAECHMVAAGLH